jgi:hypothetical protein
MLRLLVCVMRMLMGLGRVLMSQLRMLVSLFVVALLMVLGCGVVGFGGVFVVLGGFAVRFVCHRAPLIPGRFPQSRLVLRRVTWPHNPVNL